MPRLPRRPLAHLAAVALIATSLGACAKSDARPATPATVASAGEVSATPTATPAAAPAGGLGTSLTDSTSAQADRGRIRGSASSTVWLIEVSDFQCPYCKRWHDDAFAVLDREYVQTGKVRMAYINFPLSTIHPNARAAAEAAMCASAQGKFWELHESLFATQERWEAEANPMPTFDSLAVAARVNPTAWRGCMTSHATLPLIDADHDRAGQSGVKSTPTFFVGGRGLVGAYPVDTFRVVLDSAIAAAARRR